MPFELNKTIWKKEKRSSLLFISLLGRFERDRFCAVNRFVRVPARHTLAPARSRRTRPAQPGNWLRFVLQPLDRFKRRFRRQRAVRSLNVRRCRAIIAEHARPPQSSVLCRVKRCQPSCIVIAS